MTVFHLWWMQICWNDLWGKKWTVSLQMPQKCFWQFSNAKCYLVWMNSIARFFFWRRSSIFLRLFEPFGSKKSVIGGSFFLVFAQLKPCPRITGVSELRVSEHRYIFQCVAEPLHRVGVNMNLAPVLDVNSNPANPTCLLCLTTASEVGASRWGVPPLLLWPLGSGMFSDFGQNPKSTVQSPLILSHFGPNGQSDPPSPCGGGGKWQLLFDI